VAHAITRVLPREGSKLQFEICLTQHVPSA